MRVAGRGENRCQVLVNDESNFASGGSGPVGYRGGHGREQVRAGDEADVGGLLERVAEGVRGNGIERVRPPHVAIRYLGEGQDEGRVSVRVLRVRHGLTLEMQELGVAAAGEAGR